MNKDMAHWTDKIREVSAFDVFTCRVHYRWDVLGISRGKPMQLTFTYISEGIKDIDEIRLLSVSILIDAMRRHGIKASTVLPLR